MKESSLLASFREGGIVSDHSDQGEGQLAAAVPFRATSGESLGPFLSWPSQSGLFISRVVLVSLPWKGLLAPPLD